MIHRLLTALAIVMTALPVLAAELRVSFPDGGAVVFAAPSGWKAGQADSKWTVSITPEVGNSFQVLLSPIGVRDAPHIDAESLRRLVGMSAERALTQSVETSLPLHDLKGPDVRGTYFSATDRAPGPGEFKYLTQGAMAVGGRAVAFTILSNGGPRPSVEPALRMLQSAVPER